MRWQSLTSAHMMGVPLDFQMRYGQQWIEQIGRMEQYGDYLTLFPELRGTLCNHEVLNFSFQPVNLLYTDINIFECSCFAFTYNYVIHLFRL